MRGHHIEDRWVERIDHRREVTNRLARQSKGGAGLTAPRLTGPREAWEGLFVKPAPRVDVGMTPDGRAWKTWIEEV